MTQIFSKFSLYLKVITQLIEEDLKLLELEAKYTK